MATVLMTLVGCGDGASDSSGEAAQGSRSQEVVYRSALGAKLRGLDPMDIGAVNDSGVASNFYETLYQYHYLKRPYEIVPQLAAEMPQISDDGLTVTIKLRDDVFFHDDESFPDGKGRKMVASDVVYSWMRLADLKNISKNWDLLNGRIVGLDAFREYTKTVATKREVDYDLPIEGLVALDDVTLQIKLTKPWPTMLLNLAYLPLAVVPREAVEHYGDEFINHPVGTGPYTLGAWRRGSRIELVRNPNFREELYPSEGEPGDAEAGLLKDAGKPMPFIDRAVLEIIEEDQPRWLKFMAGELDAAGIPKDSFDQAINPQRELTQEMIDKGIELTKSTNPGTFWLAINMQDPVLGNNLPLRQALNAGFNREEYLVKFINGRGEPARGVLPPMYAEYNSELNSPYTAYDPEKAKALVQEAIKVHGGPLPTITFSMGGTDTVQRQMGQFVQREYKAIGLDVDPEYMDWPQLQDGIKSASLQLWQIGWFGDFPDAENFLKLYYGPNKAPGVNGTNFDNEQFNTLFEQLKVEPLGPKRVELARQLEQIVVDELPQVYTIHTIGYLLKYEWVRNRKTHHFGYGLMRYWNIDTALRDQRQGR